jgi:2-C-methyl-D-erythritol 4-phosphate cytidylyltransferase
MSMLAFERCERIAEIVVVARPCDHEALRETAAKCGITKLKTITEGGDTRQGSVIKGLKCISEDTKLVAIHDGARPLVKPEHIEKVIRDAAVFGGATLGVPVKDTIKVVNDSLITDTPYRPSLYITQTPQIFKKSVYMKAVQFAIDHELDFTDDCQLAEAIGCKVYMTTGDYTNIKITTPEDIEIAELLLRRQEKESAE